MYDLETYRYTALAGVFKSNLSLFVRENMND